MRTTLLALFVVSVATTARARTVEPGATSAGVAFGPGFKLGSPLGGSGAFLMLNGHGEYALSSSLGLTGEASVGLANSRSTRLRVGARYRLTQLDLPLSPYAFGQGMVGRLYDVLGTSLNVWGVRAGVGADYFLTASWAAGASIGWELQRTTGVRPVTFSGLELLAGATYFF